VVRDSFLLTYYASRSKPMTAHFIPHTDYIEYPEAEMKQRAADFYAEVKRRRTVREFSDRPVPREIIENCLLAAGTAPSGANLQPWHFVVIGDPDIKAKIREAAEEEEKEFYAGRAPQEWLDALAPLGTDANKEFLTIAPYLIAIFAKSYDELPDGRRVKNYYVQESVGLATGILITGLHHAGLVTLTHTPSPMGFLNKVLDRPKNERPMILLVVGYPEEGVKVPAKALQKKPLSEIATFI
jgi:nitroreductase